MLIFDQLKRNDVYLRTLTWAVLAGMTVLLGGLYYVQIIASRHYTENQISQSFRTVRIPAARGKILDRHGRALVENKATFTAGLYLEELRDLFKAEWSRSRPRHRVLRSERVELESQSRYRVVSNIAHQLSVVLAQPVPLDYATFAKHYRNQLALPLPLLTNLDSNQVARFQEHPFRAPGLDLVVHPYR
jgi:penicillin-binding protein 2